MPKFNIFIYENMNNKILYSFYEVPLYFNTEVHWGGTENNTSLDIGHVFEIHQLDPDKCIGFSNCTEMTNYLKRKLINDRNNIENIKKVPNLFFIDGKG